MPLNLDENSAQFQIRAYQPGKIQINDNFFTKSLIITPHELISNWPPQSREELTKGISLPSLKIKPDLLLIGTGSEFFLLLPDVYGHLINEGIAVEVMNTRSACLTYTALSAEDRNVAAALILT